MKALILAGGFGTRIRPLSCTRPKHLLPIANKPLLDLTLGRLAAHDVDEAVLAINFMADALKGALGKSKYGIRFHYSRDNPSKSRNIGSGQGGLGTGGPIKKAEKLLKGRDPFFVLNGDILTDANYSKIWEKHKQNSCTATIALRKVEDPSRYGVVELTKENRITKFVEKPRKDAPSNLINAGIYVLEPEIFNYIPRGKHCSIEREVFPKLANEGKLQGYEISGLWVDVGKPEDFIRANRLWLETEMKTSGLTKAEIAAKTEIKHPVAIDEGVIIREQSSIGPNVSLGKDVSVGKGVCIKESIVLPYTTISDFVTIEGAMVGESVSIGKEVKIGSGCLIGDNTTIRNGVTLARNVKVCPAKEVFESIHVSKCVV